MPDIDKLTTGTPQSNGEIWIVLSDDWELRGNGQGRVLEQQRISALKLMDLYDSLGIKSTFNVEVMQQLSFERHSESSFEIAKGRGNWKKTAVDMVECGETLRTNDLSQGCRYYEMSNLFRSVIEISTFNQ